MIPHHQIFHFAAAVAPLLESRVELLDDRDELSVVAEPVVAARLQMDGGQGQEVLAVFHVLLEQEVFAQSM